MKIVDERGKTLVRFKDLFAGDVFDACGDPAIKTSDDNAYCLQDGVPIHREPNDLVALLNVELVIS